MLGGISGHERPVRGIHTRDGAPLFAPPADAIERHLTAKERGSTILIPSSMVEGFNVPGILGMTGAVAPAQPSTS